MEQGASCPWATAFLRQAYHSYRKKIEAAGVTYSAEAFRNITDAIFGLVVYFSPSLQSLALSGSGTPWMQPFQYQKKLFLYHSPPITTLSLDLSVLQVLFGSPETGYSHNWHPCLSTVQSLTLKGFDPLEVRGLDDAAMCLGSLFDWFCMKPRLKRLEINGYDETLGLESDHTWNTILPLFKDTLEHLSMSGYMEPIDEDQMTDRFGPSRMLTCLPELEKLAYLKVPLHFVSSHRPQLIPDMAHAAPPGDADFGESDTNNDNKNNNQQDPITARNIRQQIMVEFPPLLKTADIIEYVNHRESIQGIQDWNEIRERDTYRLRL
ncbi:unnamed protein product [Sordaria macrospora k-hell]|uniref:WGS project CABT00000000 data, contig 2.152 n=1 Tax=Sordaria macrospora (strain ATCC MYA-333 / DSM 997 / K(L3346) / K-hell) TaxID=771870 RepID=F7WCK5_SORMK|nr:uncharacterized protein SMAC_09689 [Sordaria macrospora k-hell]CCC05642.1 unnamed protein product [Sordaria macrospora k-hell]